ncbi:MAG: DUF469 family protein [bacterium]|nr:DUF469 family protein [bacterium]
MNRRQRKKLYRNEFQEKGFDVSLVLDEKIEHEEFLDVLDNFFDYAESKNLCISNRVGGNNDALFVSSKFKYNSPSQEDIDSIDKWLKENNNIVKHEIGLLKDVWYSA